MFVQKGLVPLFPLRRRTRLQRRKKGVKAVSTPSWLGSFLRVFSVLRIGSLGATVLVPCYEWASFGSDFYKWSQLQGVTYARLEGI